MLDKTDLFRRQGSIELDGAEFELTTLTYDRGKSDTGKSGHLTLELRERQTGERFALSFKGVRLEPCLDLSKQFKIEILNENWQQWEGSERFGVWILQEDGSKQRLFGATTCQ